MTEEELTRIWKSSPNEERARFEKSRLMLHLQSSIDEFHRKVRFRDLREYVAVIIVIPAFAVSAYLIPHVLTKVASVLIIGYAVFVAIRLRKARRHKPGELYETYREYLHQMRSYLLVQKKLLDSVIYWYILPGFGLTMLFVLGFGIEGRQEQILKMLAGNLVLAVVTYYLNKRSVKTEIMARLARVEELINVLEKG